MVSNVVELSLQIPLYYHSGIGSSRPLSLQRVYYLVDSLTFCVHIVRLRVCTSESKCFVEKKRKASHTISYQILLFSEGALGKDFLDREKVERQKKAAAKTAYVNPKRLN